MAMEQNLGRGEKKLEKLVFYPKPQRPVSEFFYPFSCSHSHCSHQESREILDMISKKSDQEEPSLYRGSPPARSNNPVVHDPRFRQLEPFSPFNGVTLSNKFDLDSDFSI